MAVDFDAARGLSFAHLAGLAASPRAERTDDEVEQDRKEEDDETEDRRDDEDESTEDRRKKEDGDREDLGADEDDEEAEDDGDKKDTKEAKAARSAERTRWATVLGSKSFAKNPALGARLLAKTGMSANAIVGTLRDTPVAGGSASSASSSRASRNPNVGSGAPVATKPAGSSLAERMLAARGMARK